MKIVIEVTEEELGEMALTAGELQSAVLATLDSGVNLPGGGHLDMSGLNVTVSVSGS